MVNLPKVYYKLSYVPEYTVKIPTTKIIFSHLFILCNDVVIYNEHHGEALFALFLGLFTYCCFMVSFLSFLLVIINIVGFAVICTCT